MRKNDKSCGLSAHQQAFKKCYILSCKRNLKYYSITGGTSLNKLEFGNNIESKYNQRNVSHTDIENEIKDKLKKAKESSSFNSFSEYFWSLPNVKALSDSEIIKLSGIEKSYYYQIKKGKRSPGRDKIIRLCIGTKLTVQETTHALELSEYAVLYSRNRRDIILTVAINRQLTVIDTNLLLDKYNEKPLL